MRARCLLAALLLGLASTAPAQIVRTPDLYTPTVNTITAGGVSQVAIPGNPSRGWVYCQNPIGQTEPLYVEVRDAATTASYAIAAGGIWQFVSGVVPTAPINVMAATTGHPFTCRAGAN
jgi:hypothetical protein